MGSVWRAYRPQAMQETDAETVVKSYHFLEFQWCRPHPAVSRIILTLSNALAELFEVLISASDTSTDDLLEFPLIRLTTIISTTSQALG